MTILALAAFLCCWQCLVGACPGCAQSGGGKEYKPADRSNDKGDARSAANSKKAGEKSGPAGGGKKEALRPVLDSSQFVGEAAIGYASATVIPELCAKLFCYCGCDMTDNHSSLLDCYTSMHGVDCHICQEEATMALRLNREGVGMAEIQQRVDEAYENRYPFQRPTPALLKYRATRLWSSGQEAKQDTGAVVETGDQAGPPKLKPGAKLSNCCKGKHKQGGASTTKLTQ